MTKNFMGVGTNFYGGTGTSEEFESLKEAERFVRPFIFWEIRKLADGVWKIVSNSG